MGKNEESKTQETTEKTEKVPKNRYRLVSYKFEGRRGYFATSTLLLKNFRKYQKTTKAKMERLQPNSSGKLVWLPVSISTVVGLADEERKAKEKTKAEKQDASWLLK